MPKETGLLILTWVALMTLLAITVVGTLLPIGPVKGAINIAAALCKASLIYWVFMHVKQVRGFLRVAAVGAVAWVLVLGGMMFTDIVSRH